MKRFPLLTTLLAGSLFTVSLATAATECADLVMPMRVLHTDVRSGLPLSTEQQTVWRTWNLHCMTPDWQAALVHVGAPAYPPNPVPAPEPAYRTWRNDVANVLQAVADGVGRSPSVYCTTTRAGRRGHRSTVTSCY